MWTDFSSPRRRDANELPALAGWSIHAPIRLISTHLMTDEAMLEAGAKWTGEEWIAPRQKHVDLVALQPVLPRAAHREIVPELVDLIPSSSWFSSLANILAPYSWRKISKKTAEVRGGCMDCGSPVRPEAHEIWEYDDEQGIQTLTGILCLCSWCHETRHLGRARVMGNFNRAFARLSAINRLSAHEERPYINAVEDLWTRRSAQPWMLDLNLNEGVEIKLAPKIIYLGDGWMQRPADEKRPETVFRLVNVGIREGTSLSVVGVSEEALGY